MINGSPTSCWPKRSRAERDIGALPGLIEVLTIRGSIHADRGELTRATDELQRGAVERHVAWLAHPTGQRSRSHVWRAGGCPPAACVRMAAAADELRDAGRALPRPSERRRLGTHLRQARQRLGEAAYTAVWKAARRQPLDAIVEEGRALLGQVGGRLLSRNRVGPRTY